MSWFAIRSFQRTWSSAIFRTSLLLFAGMCALPSAQAQDNSPKGPGGTVVQAQMRNLQYHYSTSAAVRIKFLTGELLPVTPSEFPIFDNKDSFRIRVTAAEIAIPPDDLANIFNSYVFAGSKSPLTGVSMAIQDGHLMIKGKLNIGKIPFETQALLTPTSDGKIVMRTGSVKALHVPVKGFMSLFNVDIADLIKNGKLTGVQASGDDLILDPSSVFPAPHLEGTVTAIRIENNAVVLNFGKPATNAKPRQSGNYIYFRGGRLQFGKLTMTDVDITLLDMDPADPFDFFLDHYREQLEAGYTKIAPGFGLRIYMKDFDKLPKSSAKAKTQDQQKR